MTLDSIRNSCDVCSQALKAGKVSKKKGFLAAQNFKNYQTGRGEGECYTENVNTNGQSYTIENIKTNEAGSWKFVFDIYEDTQIKINVFDSWSCNNLVESETKCTSGQTEYTAGPYTVEFSSDADFPWRVPKGRPTIKTFKVGDKDYCEGEICK